MSWDKSYRYFIPVQLCEHALKKNLCNQFRLYCYLKGQCSGKMKIDVRYVKNIATDLQCTPKTILNHLKKLQELNWIGYNPKSGYYIIRGFETLMQMQDFTARTGAEFKKEYLITFKNFLAGAVIGYIANTIRKKQAFERKKARSNQEACSSNGYQVSNRYVAKKLNVSLGFAHKIKKLAAGAGFVKIQRTFINTNVLTKEKKYYTKAFPEKSGRLRNKEGLLVLVDADKILSTIRFKKRKKRERYIKQGITNL